VIVPTDDKAEQSSEAFKKFRLGSLNDKDAVFFHSLGVHKVGSHQVSARLKKDFERNVHRCQNIASVKSVANLQIRL
jgi:hypothetical protein